MRLAALAPVLLAACSRGDAASLPRATVDTLAGGVVRVRSDQPTGWADSSRAWQVEEVLRIQGEEGTPGELIEPGSIGVDGAGRIYVADKKPAVIKVFDPTGALVRTIGREGSGPGEFRIAFMAVKGGTVVVQDPQQARTSVFDTSGAFLRSWKSSCCYWDDVYIDADDRVYIPSMAADIPGEKGERAHSRGRAFVRYRLDGDLIDTLFVPSREDAVKIWTFASKGRSGKGQMMMSTSVPFSPTLVQAFHPAGGFVIGWTGDFRIVRAPHGSDTAGIVERTWTPDPIPEPVRRARVEDMVKNAKDLVGEAAARSIARLEDIPATAPAFVNLRVDPEGYLYARRLVESDSTRTVYDVFGPDGAWLGAVTVRAKVPEWGSQLFARGAIYSAIEDEDGRPAVVKLAIRR